MLLMNQRMLNVMERKAFEDNKSKSDLIINEVVENTILKNDCLLYDKEKTIQKSSVSALWIKETFFDLSGYEASINEIRYDKTFFSDVNIFRLLDKLHNEIETKFCRKIVVYFSLHDTEVEIRFHTHRPSEADWLMENLDAYDSPVLCMK